ncbi:hypothetical protein [Actinopolymorpha pittospori]
MLLIQRSDTGRWGLPAGSAEPHSTSRLPRSVSSRRRPECVPR